MKRLICWSGLVLGALLPSVSSFAAPLAHASAPITARAGDETASTEALAPPGVLAQRLGPKEIYSTFNPNPNRLYDRSLAWVISTVDSLVDLEQTVAMPFTPTEDATLKSIELGLSYFLGANKLKVALAEDANGTPGTKIKGFKVTDIPPGGDCCLVEAVAPKGVNVKADVTYWVVVSATADTWGGWNFNSIGATGTWVYDNGDGWQQAIDVYGAFRVLAR